MKKYLLPILVAIVALVLVGLGLVYLAPKGAEKAPEKSTKQAITELLTTKLGSPTRGLVVEVTTDTGAFAKGTFNVPEAGGGIWFAAKTTKGWSLASAGNGIVSCQDIETYNFPKDMVPQCLDTHN